MSRNTRVVNAVTSEIPVTDAGYYHADVDVANDVVDLGDFHTRCSRVIVTVEADDPADYDTGVRVTYDGRDPSVVSGSEVGHPMPIGGSFDVNVTTARKMKFVSLVVDKPVRLLVTEFE